MKHIQDKNKGFTLIELLVAIAIIGVLAAVLVANLVGARGRARDASRKENLSQMRTALRLYYNDFQSYPAGTASISGTLCSGGVCDEGAQFLSGSTVYMKALPEHTYHQTASGEGFTLTTQLDNPSDSSITTGYAKCCPTVVGGCPVDSATAVSSRTLVMCED